MILDFTIRVLYERNKGFHVYFKTIEFELQHLLGYIESLELLLSVWNDKGMPENSFVKASYGNPQKNNSIDQDI